MRHDPLLSLVTGHVDRPDSLLRLIRSIERNTIVHYEIIIVDASSVPFEYDSQRVTIIPERPRLSNTQGYNMGFTAARGSWIIWLNDDAEVLPGYDELAIAFMERNPYIGLGALYYSEDGGPYHVNSAWGCIYANFGIIHKAVGSHVGWFDTDLTMYGNDNSLTFRVLLAGHGVADIPGTRIIHHSVKDQTRVDNQQSRLRDNDILYAKYWPKRQQWMSTYQRLYIPSGIEPWTHGVPPTGEPVDVSAMLQSLNRQT